MKKELLFITLIFLTVCAPAQDPKTDSLKKVLLTAKHDTTKCNALNELINLELDDKVWEKYNDALRTKAEAGLRNYKKGNVLHNTYLGYLGTALNNHGLLRTLRGDIKGAMQAYEKAIELEREVNDKEGEAVTLANIGNLYDDQADHKKAMEYYNWSYKIRVDLHDTIGLASVLNNMGTLYDALGQKDKSLEFHLRSIEMCEAVGDKKEVDTYVYALSNTSLSYNKLGKMDLALKYAQQAVATSRNENYEDGLTFSLYCLGDVYLAKRDYANAMQCATESYNIAKQIGYPDNISKSARLLARVYERQGNSTKALEFYRIEEQADDSILNSVNRKEALRFHYQSEFNAKATADSVRAIEAKKVSAAQLSESKARIQTQKTQRFVLYGGLLLVLVFAVFIFNRFRLTKKQSRLIEIKEQEARCQKELVAAKQKEVIDSIAYAKRIQSSILATETDIKKHFPESYLLYKPKDIVAGDFYFFETTATHVFYAAADCTGHGVPGALMSVVCSNALTRCVKEFGLTDPGMILDKTRELVIDTFKKSGQNVKDGMDISLISLRFNVQSSMSTSNIKPETLNFELQWAGANNPLWIIHAPKTEGSPEVQEIKPNRQPIGITDKPRPFTTHSLTLEKGAEIILLTDGYADQFGGPEGKKLKDKTLKSWLLEAFTLPNEHKAAFLDQKFEAWKGKRQQIDDVCVIGVRL